MAGGYLRYDIPYLEQLPIADFTERIPENHFIRLSKHINILKSTNNDSTYYENKIDALVFHLYGLTEVEMNQVLDTFKDLISENRNHIVREYVNIANSTFQLEI